ncbi:hypothetical protein Desaci_0295 [Desulfosporosinus acidiphilus SJ4]|uniref:Lipoprotein n=1 Tax=Desulfosporosinus acidiphilus (strain DSM 22704 / JCM 16185 / SJ4) TaxID=646529 RepID=I4D0P3_DESAJ|nr:hypothetical protein [Desulfosporosinus acidiphilus]AFM39367.1 hypothetical protein Desaci_0295 [Desulfosporosinus acidiphilus SJ4]
MRRIAACFLLIFLVLGVTACNTKTPNGTTQNTVTYTKEFSYLPAYGNMEYQSLTETNQGQTARYLIKNTTVDKVLTGYGDILKTDGWTLNWSYTKDKKPASLVAQKDNHTVALLPRQDNKDVLLIVSVPK